MEFNTNFVIISLSLILMQTGDLCSGKEPKRVFSPAELEAIAKLRNMAKDIIAHDTYFDKPTFLMRWLRARNMDVEAADLMFREAFKWRADNKIDGILQEDILHLAVPPYTFSSGSDKENRPVVFFTPTATDLRKLILQGLKDKAVRSFDQMLERGYHALRNVTKTMSNGEEVLQFIAILDMTGFNIIQHFCVQCVSVYLEWFHHYENYYPDALKYFVVINMNRLAVPLFEVVRPFLSEATQESIVIFGPNRKEWSDFLTSLIPAKNLPYRFGGIKGKN